MKSLQTVVLNRQAVQSVLPNIILGFLFASYHCQTYFTMMTSSRGCNIYTNVTVVTELKLELKSMCFHITEIQFDICMNMITMRKKKGSDLEVDIKVKALEIHVFSLKLCSFTYATVIIASLDYCQNQMTIYI